MTRSRTATVLVCVLMALGTAMAAPPPKAKAAKKAPAPPPRGLAEVAIDTAGVFGLCATPVQMKLAPDALLAGIDPKRTIDDIKSQLDAAGFSWEDEGKGVIVVASREPGASILNLVTKPVPPGSYTGFEVLQLALKDHPSGEIQVGGWIQGCQCLAQTIVIEKEIKGTTLRNLMNDVAVRVDGNFWHLGANINAVPGEVDATGKQKTIKFLYPSIVHLVR